MGNLEKIKRMSRFWHITFLILIGVTVFFNLAYWIAYDYLPPMLRINIYYNIPNETPLEPIHIILNLLVSLIPLSVYVLGMLSLINLFKLFAKGEIFSLKTVKYLKQFGIYVCLWVVAFIIADTLLTFIFSHFDKEQGHILLVKFTSSYIGLLVLGGLVFLIARIMQEGYEIYEEQKLTI